MTIKKKSNTHFHPLMKYHKKHEKSQMGHNPASKIGKDSLTSITVCNKFKLKMLQNVCKNLSMIKNGQLLLSMKIFVNQGGEDWWVAQNLLHVLQLAISNGRNKKIKNPNE